jgi:hypothetical protein
MCWGEEVVVSGGSEEMSCGINSTRTVGRVGYEMWDVWNEFHTTKKLANSEW